MHPPVFVPPLPPSRRKQIRFNLKTLFLMITCVGPLALVAHALPIDYYATQGRFTFEIVCVAGLAWCASWVRPYPLAICCFLLVLVSSVCGFLLCSGLRVDYDVLFAALNVSVRTAIVMGLALGLSCSRHA